MSIYDSHIPLLVENVTFMNYPAKDLNGAPRHAMGAHMSHKHALIPKAVGLKDIKYINVDRYWQNAEVGTSTPQTQGGDQFNKYVMWGDDHKTQESNSIRSTVANLNRFFCVFSSKF